MYTSPNNRVHPPVRFSIDVETAGDNPHNRALLEVGLCVVDDLTISANFMFRPSPLTFDRRALRAIKRPIEEFLEKGEPLEIGINDMLDFIDTVAKGRVTEFFGLNIAFDWMFFITNVAKVSAAHSLPHKAYDIPSYGAGVFGLPLSRIGGDTLIRLLAVHSPHLVEKFSLHKKTGRAHYACEDALYQARLLLALEEYAKRRE